MPILPDSAVDLELALVSAIKDTLLSVPEISSYVQVWARDRFPDNKDDEIATSTMPDLVNADKPMTSVIQIGIPSIYERGYTDDKHTSLDLVYPITFDLGVKDQWANQLGTVPFTDSRLMAMAIYMKARKAFKDNKTLGFNNVEHDFLQQEGQSTVEEEETGGMIHAIDWSLTVHVKGTRA